MSDRFMKIQLTLATASIICVAVGLLYPKPEPPPPPPLQWEYQIQAISDLTFDADMNRAGDLGWEMVFARRASNGEDTPTFSYEVIFKRPKAPLVKTADQ